MPYFYNEQNDYICDTIKSLKDKIYKKVARLTITAWKTNEPVSYDNRTCGEKMELQVGDKWGDLFDCAWFNFKGSVPDGLENESVVLIIDISGEMCIFDHNGCPVQGLTNVSSGFDYELGQPGKRIFWLGRGVKDIDIWGDAGCNDLFGGLKGDGRIIDADIAVCNESARDLFYDFTVLFELYKQLEENCARRYSVLYSLIDACNVLKRFNDDEVKRAREILAAELNKKNGDVSLKVSAVGHSHLDLAWLWPVRETIRKGARTFATALKMMERYPDYVYGSSQPQLFAWIKEYYPQLYQKVKERVDEGRFEVQGAMWVESDTNITGGESLVRQILYGKRFFRKEFNKDVQVLWLPDAFGYSGALPQLLVKAGVYYFMTQKLSWNKHNTYPHHTFVWKGIDGSEVFTHMLPENTYNSPASPRAVRTAELNFIDKGVCDECLMLFGIGDGGGGPAEEHLENLKREKNLNGIAPVTQEPSINFFKRQEKFRSRLNTWSGELYLERHQGTYTTQGRIKRWNRLMEVALKRLELAASKQIALLGINGCDKEDINKMWKEVLLYQFHDILPGSSIDRVYEECESRYEQLYSKVNRLIDEIYAKFGGGRLAVNSLSWEVTQYIKDNGIWYKATAPSMGFARLEPAKDSFHIIVQNDMLENDKLRVMFNGDGSIKSVFDKEARREVLAGTSNRLSIYHEAGGDCWDFNMLYDNKQPDSLKLQTIKAYIDGPQAVLERELTYNKSTFIQKTVLTHKSRRIDFITEVDWQETGKMLRTAFDLNIQSSSAVCGIQFGSINRPTHRNTNWDMAKYEICAHKWVDISRRDYGAAVLSDCKYGFKVTDNSIDINLLRSPTFPGRHADKGRHTFTYSLYPHNGDHIVGEVNKTAYELCEPLQVIDACGEESLISEPFVEISCASIVVEAVKRAEDSDDIIFRMYQSVDACCEAEIKFGFEAKRIEMVDLMEENPVGIPLQDNRAKIGFKPFEIITLKVKP